MRFKNKHNSFHKKNPSVRGLRNKGYYVYLYYQDSIQKVTTTVFRDEGKLIVARKDLQLYLNPSDRSMWTHVFYQRCLENMKLRLHLEKQTPYKSRNVSLLRLCPHCVKHCPFCMLKNVCAFQGESRRQLCKFFMCILHSFFL